MQSIVSKGKDVKEAIQLGLDLLELTIKEVNIEILQQPTKGFMGIGSKSAIVKLSKEDVKKPSQTMDYFESLEKMVQEFVATETSPRSSHFEIDRKQVDETTEALAGKAWVRDGKLYCKDSPYQYPTVAIGKGVQLFKNNEIVKDNTTILTEKDLFEIKVDNEEQSTKWHVSIDPSKLKVLLEIKPGFKMTRKVRNIDPDQHIEIAIDEHKEVMNTLTYQDVMQKLASLHVKYGFNQDEIVKALEATEPSTFEIATGVDAKPGKDGWIELKVEMDTKNGLKEDASGKVDFRESKTIPTVEHGEILAIIHPPVPGKPGVTVTNEPLPAQQTFPITVQAGRGITVVDDKIVAIESGRPVIEQRRQLVKVSVLPRLVHTGHVDLSSGNIRFSGDIEILGGVEERMMVEAEGDLIVHDIVNMATLTAHGAIISRSNVIGSELSAGKNNMLVAELGQLLGVMNKQIENMVAVIKQLTQAPAFKSSDFARKGLRPLLQILLGNKFKNFPPLARKYVEVTRKREANLGAEEWKEVATVLNQLFLSLSNQPVSLERMIDLSKKMKDLHEFSQTPVEPDSYITISSALNSQLYCSGNVTIIGQGCMNSNIHAGGSVTINGILRGGEVYGKLGIRVHEVGSESGTATVISVPSDQTIKITKAMEGTIIKIGHVKYIFTETRHHVLACLNKEERIVFA